MNHRIEAEWNRAQDCFLAAEICYQSELYADAVSRAYYAVLHASKAALLIFGVETKSHRGQNMMLVQYLVTPGLIESRWHSEMDALHAKRIAADYRTDKAFGEPDAASALATASSFFDQVRPLLGNAAGPIAAG